jgi:integrase/recombinase XerD
MKHYDQYLKEQDYSKNTIDTYLRAKEKFVLWCDSKGYEVEAIDYKSCLEYTKKMQLFRNGRIPSKSTTKHQIGALKIYFNYLIDENYRGDNPMESIRRFVLFFSNTKY